ncbi:hypothetical protein HELRODRAFT_86631, partial [Helobdella robusta]|uniref:Neurotransmitter-gated ion-channel ligand-binding domain-containing protein n=1 Tax=Helobdella robusta TaxID=6412 RepID=T1G6E6_HELRO
LFHDYHPMVRPVRDMRAPVNVTIDYELYCVASIVSLGPSVFTLYAFHRNRWIDEYLKWNESEHGNIKSIVTRASQIWTPDITVRNGLLDMNEDSSTQEVSVTSQGEVNMNIFRVMTTFCDLDLKYFPFDKQTCYISANIWSYTTDQVSRTTHTHTHTHTRTHAHTHTHTHTQTHTHTYTHSNTHTQEIAPSSGFITLIVNFKIHLARNPQFYLTYFLFSCVVSASVSTFVFLMPSDSQQMVDFGVTIMLSFNFFLNSMYFILPQTGDYIPCLTMYVIFVMFVSFFFLFFTITNLMLYYHQEDDPPPSWLQHIVLDKLAWFI